MAIGSRLEQAVRKARGRSAAELWERAGQAIAARLERAGLAGLTREPTDREFARYLAPSLNIRSGVDPATFHEHFVNHPGARFFSAVADAPAIGEYLRTQSPETVQSVIDSAEHIRDGSFDLLGYTGLSFGNPIDWHLDPTTGKKAPTEHWSRISYLDPTVVGDHKVIWELNRHQHFMVLGRAYRMTGREEFARAFVDQVVGWMNENPPNTGVNWASSLEVAYRLIAWLWALEFFRPSPVLTSAIRLRMHKFLYVHATHLERYLSTYFSPNTHLTGEALGLVYAGSLLPEFRRSRGWADVGWSILETQLFRQVLPDGVYFEQATYYHRYTADIYLHAVLLARASGRSESAAISERLDLLIDHLADITRPDGSIPSIGDDDGGRLAALEERGCNDVRAPLATAAVLFGRPKYAFVAGVIPEETLWLVGLERAAALDGMRSASPAEGSRAFALGGYAVMRDGWDANANIAVIDCGPHGTANCGHSHADALSVDLTVSGCAMFIDPGTFGYTVSSTDRDLFRATAMHNTLTLDGESSSVPAGPFSWLTRTNAQLDMWWTSLLIDYFVGSHRGYERISAGSVHERRVFFTKGSGYWIIWDTIAVARAHEVVVHFHAAPGTVVSRDGPRSTYVERSFRGGRAGAAIAAFGTTERVRWSTAWVSECYGRRVLAPVCGIYGDQSERQDIVSVIVPTTSPDSVIISPVDADGGYAITVSLPQATDTVTLRTATRLSTEVFSTDAEIAWVRRRTSGGQIEKAAILNGHSLQAGHLRFDAAVGVTEGERPSQSWRTLDPAGRASVGAGAARLSALFTR